MRSTGIVVAGLAAVAYADPYYGNPKTVTKTEDVTVTYCAPTVTSCIVGPTLTATGWENYNPKPTPQYPDGEHWDDWDPEHPDEVGTWGNWQAPKPTPNKPNGEHWDDWNPEEPDKVGTWGNWEAPKPTGKGHGPKKPNGEHWDDWNPEEPEEVGTWGNWEAPKPTPMKPNGEHWDDWDPEHPEKVGTWGNWQKPKPTGPPMKPNGEHWDDWNPEEPDKVGTWGNWEAPKPSDKPVVPLKPNGEHWDDWDASNPDKVGTWGNWEQPKPTPVAGAECPKYTAQGPPEWIKNLPKEAASSMGEKWKTGAPADWCKYGYSTMASVKTSTVPAATETWASWTNVNMKGTQTGPQVAKWTGAANANAGSMAMAGLAGLAAIMMA